MTKHRLSRKWIASTAWGIFGAVVILQFGPRGSSPPPKVKQERRLQLCETPPTRDHIHYIYPPPWLDPRCPKPVGGTLDCYSRYVLYEKGLGKDRAGLLKLAADSEAEEGDRLHAIRLLGTCKPEAPVEPLRRLLDDPRPAIRQRALASLLEVDRDLGAASARLLVDAEPDPSQKLSLALAVADHGPPIAIKSLAPGLKFESWTLRRRAVTALASIVKRGHEDPVEFERGLRALRTALRDDHLSVRWAALRGVDRLESKGLVAEETHEPLLMAAEEVRDELRKRREERHAAWLVEREEITERRIGWKLEEAAKKLEFKAKMLLPDPGEGPVPCPCPPGCGESGD